MASNLISDLEAIRSRIDDLEHEHNVLHEYVWLSNDSEPLSEVASEDMSTLDLLADDIGRSASKAESWRDPDRLCDKFRLLCRLDGGVDRSMRIVLQTAEMLIVQENLEVVTEYQEAFEKCDELFVDLIRDRWSDVEDSQIDVSVVDEMLQRLQRTTDDFRKAQGHSDAAQPAERFFPQSIQLLLRLEHGIEG